MICLLCQHNPAVQGGKHSGIGPVIQTGEGLLLYEKCSWLANALSQGGLANGSRLAVGDVLKMSM